MKFSYCTGIDNAQYLADAGFDGIDLFVPESISARIPEKEFRANMVKFQQSPLPLICAAGLLPSDLQVVGPSVDRKKNMDFMDKTLSRSKEAGISQIVFGSNKSRTVPEGFSWLKAAQQLETFVRESMEYAEKYGVTIVLEPLRTECTNTITTVASGATLVNKINNPYFKLLIDYFHFYRCDMDFVAFAWALPLLHHVHICGRNREIPGTVEYDYTDFMRILKQGGYNGYISVEPGVELTSKSAAVNAYKTLIKAWENA